MTMFGVGLQLGTVSARRGNNPDMIIEGGLPESYTTGFDVFKKTGVLQGSFVLDVTLSAAPEAAGFVYYLDDNTSNDRLGVAYDSSARLQLYAERNNDGYMQGGNEGRISSQIVKNHLNQSIGLKVSASEYGLWFNGLKIFKNANPSVFTDPIVNFCVGEYKGASTLPAASYGGFNYWHKPLPEGKMSANTRVTEALPGISFNDDLDVYVCMGQSNIVKGVSGAHSYTNTDKMFMIEPDGVTLSAFADPYGDSSGNIYTPFLDVGTPATTYIGPFLDAISGETGRDTAVFAAGKNNTSLKVEWNNWIAMPAGTGLVTSFERWAALMRVVTAAQHGHLRGVIIHHGESDALSSVGTTRSEYVSLFEAVYIEGLRQVLGYVPQIYLVKLHQWPSPLSGSIPENNWEDIQAAQEDLASAHPSFIKLVDFSALPGKSGDEVHLDIAEQVTAGGILADAVLEVQQG